MAEDEKKNSASKQSFWTTIPGILTGAAALVTAITGMMIGLYQNGFFGKSDALPKTTDSHVSGDSLRPAPIRAPESSKPIRTGSSQLTSSGTQPTEPMVAISTIDGSITNVTERSVKFLLDKYIPLESGQRIRFEKLKAIEFLEFPGNDIRVRLTLLDDSTIGGVIPSCGSGCEIDGENKLGEFAVSARRVRTVTFQR